MDDTAKVFGIFGGHLTRSNSDTRLRIRDADLVAELKARFSDLAARDNRARDAGWLIDYSPLLTDELTERSLFDATLTSAVHGTHRLSFALGPDWVQMGDGALESTVRNDARDVHRAMQTAFRRIVRHGTPPATVSRSRVRVVSL